MPLLALGGCGKEEVKAPPLLPPSAAVGTATVLGRVRFLGTPPAMKVLDDKCYPGAEPVRDESVLVDDGGGLANVLVHLDGGPAVDGATLFPPVLDQKNCRYVPHVIGVTVNQPLTVRSDDPVFHNVHYDPVGGPAENLTFESKGQARTARFATPQIVRARCDVHPWMNAYIGVLPNPLFAVTGTGGGFSIKAVPAGDYTLIAWHERYGEVRRPVHVDAGGTVKIDLEYAPPGAKDAK